MRHDLKKHLNFATNVGSVTQLLCSEINSRDKAWDAINWRFSFSTYNNTNLTHIQMLLKSDISDAQKESILSTMKQASENVLRELTLKKYTRPYTALENIVLCVKVKT